MNEKDLSWGSIDLGSREKPITVEEEPDDDVVCLDVVIKNRKIVGNLPLEKNLLERVNRHPKIPKQPGNDVSSFSRTFSTNVGHNGKEVLGLNNVPGPSSSAEPKQSPTGKDKRKSSKEILYFPNPMFALEKEKLLSSINVSSSLDTTSAKNARLVGSLNQKFGASSINSNQFSTLGVRGRRIENFWKGASSTVNGNFDQDTLRRPSYLASTVNSSTSNLFAGRNKAQDSTTADFRNRNDQPRKYPPRVPGSVDVFVTHRDDFKRRVTMDDLNLLNNYLGQCMYEEEETDFIMGFEYKKITYGQAQFNCSNKQMAEWTIEKIANFSEIPMQTSLKSLRPKINAFMWMSNLPHLGDTLPKMPDVLRGLTKCNPGFMSHFEITVIRVNKQKWRLGKYFFQVMVNEELLSYLKSRMEPPFMHLCVLKYYNVKVFFKERG